MIEDRLKKLEQQIEAADKIPEQSRAELLELLAALRSEITALPSTQAEDARNITAFAETSTLEVLRENIRPLALKTALNELTGAVKKFETSRPDMAAILNRLSIVLSNMGM